MIFDVFFLFFSLLLFLSAHRSVMLLMTIIPLTHYDNFGPPPKKNQVEKKTCRRSSTNLIIFYSCFCFVCLFVCLFDNMADSLAGLCRRM